MSESVLPSREKKSSVRHAVLRICGALSVAAFVACQGIIVGDRGSGDGPGNGLGGGTDPSGEESGGGTDPSGDGPFVLDSGHTTLRRLNRDEYNNTVRDLLGSNLRPADDFPPDDISVEGFDTVGRAQNFTALHGEQAEAGSFALVNELMARPEDDAIRNRIVVCTVSAENADACTREILSGFMRRAFRRPVTTEEIDDFVLLAGEIRDNGGTPEDGLRAALRATLLSPHFLYLIELDADPLSPEVHRVSDHELAVRLSYFLWSTMPDDTLFDAVDSGALTEDPAEVGRQFDRMMEDPRSDALFARLSAQWLRLQDVNQLDPSPDVFPDFDESLRLGMRQESELFFKSLVREEMPIEALLLADYTYADARLALHYGLPSAPDSMTRVSLEGTPRGGILTQASFLSITSYPYRTSPVNRGAWVLEQLLCAPPPAVPEDLNLADFEAPTAAEEGLTLRESMERHQTDPACANCHALFDPIGFGLENFDAIGSYRTLDNGGEIDSSGELGGEPFEGATELAERLASDPRFVPCVIEHVMTYAVGRSFHSRDAKGYIQGISQDVRELGGTWRGVLRAIVESEAFQTRRGGSL